MSQIKIFICVLLEILSKSEILLREFCSNTGDQMCFGIPDSLHLESAETYISNIYQPKQLLNMSSAKHINIYTQRHVVVINESMAF